MTSTSRRAPSLTVIAGLVAALAMVGPVPPAATAPAPASAPVTAWVTSPTDAGRRLLPVAPTDAASTRPVVVSPVERYQSWLGTGAALTDSSVGLLGGRPAAQSMLFDPSDPTGAHLNLVRLPLSATDFSERWWTWAWDPVRRVATPTPEAEQAVTMLGSLVARRPDLSVLATPWTAPAELTTPRTIFGGGELAAGSESSYGELLVAQTNWLRARGVPLRSLTIGNEPATSASDYPRMKMSNEQMLTIAKAIEPRLSAQGVDLWAMDHNWEHRPRVDGLLEGAPGTFAAAAFHCYGPTAPERMAGLPVPPIMTECTGTTDGWADTFRWDAVNLVVEPVKAGSTGLFMWNLALRPDHGPHRGGCDDCRGLLEIDPATGTVRTNPEYYTLAHLARAADPGAVRIGARSSDGLPVAAFANPDGTIGVFGHNDTGAVQVVGIRAPGRSESRISVRPGELFTFRGPPGDPVGLPLGKIVRAVDGSRSYLDLTGYRHRIDADAVAACHGGEANTLNGVPVAAVNSLPEAEPAACFTGRAGDIVRHPDGDSYVLDQLDGELVRHWIPPGTADICTRAEGRRSVAAARYQITAIRAAVDRYRTGCIVRAPGGDAHVVNREGRREWIPDSPTWDCATHQPLPVHDVPAGFVEPISEAGWHYCLDRAALRGKVLRHHDGDAHVIHPDDTRTWIPDAPTMACRMRRQAPLVETRWRQYVDVFRDTGWDYCYDIETMKGRVLTHPDGDSHLVDTAGVRHWIPTNDVLACLRARGVPVDVVRWRQYIDRTPEGARARCP
jgi:glucosylceramidase